LTIFGPGAVIASLTIGSGELIFSSRGGALFGYRLLFFFFMILAFKWVLVFASARHMVLTGAHPFERWMELPGPRGWFPTVFFLLAILCFPIWGVLPRWHHRHSALLAGRDRAIASWRSALSLGHVNPGGVLVLVFAGGYAAFGANSTGDCDSDADLRDDFTFPGKA
jgi:hypothetical protein